MSTTVVVCAYTIKRLPFIKTLVERLSAQSLPIQEVILVVDPDEDLAETLKKELPQWVKIVQSPRRGASAARNCGLELAKCDIVAFVDDDAYPDAEWHAELAQAFGDNPDALAIGGYIEATWEGGRPSWFPPEFDWIVGSTYRGHPSGTTEVRGLATANMAARTDGLRAIGGFSESIGRVGRLLLSGEDIDACIRLKAAFPGRILFTERARVFHQVPRSRAQFRYFLERAYFGGIAIRHIYALHGRDIKATERSYLGQLFKYGPDETVFQRIIRTAAKIAGVGAVAMGYVAAPVVLRRARMAKL